ncbi:MAG: PAS domain-containing protein [Phycisphaerales bacterium]|nr:PAS domain-containing protein [Phycisphaerales bacterium]
MMTHVTPHPCPITQFLVEHAGDLCSSLVAEPGTGITVIAADGRWVYMNLQAAEILFGPGADPARYLGRRWVEFMPPEWVEDRMELNRRMLLNRERPVMLRVIWRGQQHFTWIRHVTREAEAPPEAPELFLLITRRSPTNEASEELTARTAFEMVDSSVMNLGRLDVLSPRELEVTALLGQGLSVKEIASILHRSEKTVDHHRVSIYEKLKVHDRVALAEIARAAGLKVEDAERRRV